MILALELIGFILGVLFVALCAVMVLGAFIGLWRSALVFKSNLPWKEKLKKLGYRPERESFSKHTSR